MDLSPAARGIAVSWAAFRQLGRTCQWLIWPTDAK